MAKVKANLSNNSTTSDTNLNDSKFDGKMNADSLIEMSDSLASAGYTTKQIIEYMRNNAKSQGDFLQALADYGYTIEEAEKILNNTVSSDNKLAEKITKEEIENKYPEIENEEATIIYEIMQRYDLEMEEAYLYWKKLNEEGSSKADEYIQSLGKRDLYTNSINNSNNSKTNYSIANHTEILKNINRETLEMNAIIGLANKYPAMTDEEILEIIQASTDKQLKEMGG